MNLKKVHLPSGIELAYESFGREDAPPVLLIMDVGGQMLGWHESFCDELVTQGVRPIRFDNRDVGLSSHLHEAPLPNFMAALAGDTSSASYNLSDMASDTIGLLDALGLPSAHLVGASMGGYIAQMVAIEYSDRVRSLTSMMSTTGNPTVGQPAPEAMRLFAGARPRRTGEVGRHTRGILQAARKCDAIVKTPSQGTISDLIRGRDATISSWKGGLHGRPGLVG